MKRIILNVPENVNYLSDWQNFDKCLSRGKVILDKSICGCGCTEAYLTNDMPIILVSPRRELINCKVKKPNRLRPLHYFDRSGKKNVDVKTSLDQLWSYLSTNAQPGFAPKLIVTYDSVKIVLDFLAQQGLLDSFSIIVDEFPCIFTDAKLKGSVELNMIKRINALQNHVVFISATPIKDIYLDATLEFHDIPIYTLQWHPSRYEQIRIVRQTMKSTKEACSRVISDYHTNGFFKSTIINGVVKYSTEALFFLNSVRDIAAIIRKHKLTPNDAIVICAEDDKNRLKLKEVGFEVGHVNDEVSYKTENKPFTFITKASFEGTDFYSDCSSTYIFADPGISSLSLDISIDLPQIAGRCRTECNPFRNEITYFYKTSELRDIDKLESEINSRISNTNDFLRKFGNTQDYSLLKKIKNAQEVEKYKDDYIDVTEAIDDTGEPTMRIEGNTYAQLADLRGIEILRAQYNSNFSVFVSLEHNGFSTPGPYYHGGNILDAFYSNFSSDNNFTRKMKLYADFLESHPELKANVEAIPHIPMNYKSYYNQLSPGRLRALKYRENAIIAEINKRQSFLNIQNALTNVLTSKQYTTYELKVIIQQVYDSLNIMKTAKGTDIEKYFPSVQSISMTDKDGKRKKGYRLWK